LSRESSTGKKKKEAPKETWSWERTEHPGGISDFKRRHPEGRLNWENAT